MSISVQDLISCQTCLRHDKAGLAQGEVQGTHGQSTQPPCAPEKSILISAPATSIQVKACAPATRIQVLKLSVIKSDY